MPQSNCFPLHDPRPSSVIRKPSNLVPAGTGHHELTCHSGEPGADQFGQLLDREAVRQHRRLGATIAPAVGEQLKGADVRRAGVMPRRVSGAVSGAVSHSIL